MKKPLFLVIALLVAWGTFAQTETKPLPEFDGYHKNIFVEGLGAGIFGSVNFDMRLQRGRMDGLGFRVGIGGAPAQLAVYDSENANYSGFPFFGQRHEKGYAIDFPLEINYLVGKRRSSFLAGVGVIPIVASIPSKNITKFALGGGYVSLGYRYQPLRHGFMFQVNWNPLITQSGFSAKWFGIGIGYGFK